MEASWHAATAQEVLDRLKADAHGLSEADSRRRLTRYGPNEFTRGHGRDWVHIALRQFGNPLILILLAAGALSAVLGASLDAAIVLVAVGINVVIGFVQEYKVSDILARLSRELKESATVLRRGVRTVVDARQLAPGDIVLLARGDRVPADVRIIKASGFKTNEAALTGESFPVDKSARPVAVDAPLADRTSMAYLGTFAEEGVAQVVVVATGPRTELGRISSIIERERGRDFTPLQRKFTALARTMGFVFVGLSALLFVIGVAGGREPLSMFLTSVAVAVAAVPESLPVVLSVVLAVGARRILARGGLVRKMSAAEALGGVTVVATDKTATLTEGRMEVTQLVLPDGTVVAREEFATSAKTDAGRQLFERLALVGDGFVADRTLPRSQWRVSGTPVDRAVLAAALEAGLDDHTLSDQYSRLAQLPFDARRKYAATLRADGDSAFVVVLGAPEVILELCRLSGQRARELSAYVEQLAGEGLRLVALASATVEPAQHIVPERLRQLDFLGLVVMSDPIRPEVAEVIAVAQRAGTRVIMVTGDHALTAQYIARQVGILREPGRILTGRDLPEDVGLAISRADVFARVDPEHKVRIVEALKAQGEVVAMIGDGVNDAPSLLRADIGVAVGSGTDVAKDASDLVLLNDSFGIIVEAIRQGRIIFDNIRKATVFLLSDAFAEIVLITASVVLGLPLALLPAQILWVNIVADVFPALALAVDRGHEDVMTRRPRAGRTMLDRGTWGLVGLFALVTNIALIATFVLTLSSGGLEYARTMTFVGLGITSVLYVFSVRSLQTPVWRANPFGNRLLNAAVLVGFALYAVAVYVPAMQGILHTVPLSAVDWGVLFGLGVVSIGAFELGKYLFLAERKEA